MFYLPNMQTSSSICKFSKEEAHHCTRVLRLNNASKALASNGNGLKAEGKIRIEKECVFMDIEQYEEVERKYTIHILLAPTKSFDRMVWLIEKLSELGIDSISFFSSRYSQRKHINVERLENKAIAAMKQSLHAYVPKINPIQDFNTLLGNQAKRTNKFIALEGAKNYIQDELKLFGSYIVLIGSEGGFSDEEVEQAREVGFKDISLHPTRLRTETAAWAASYAIQAAHLRLGFNQ